MLLNAAQLAASRRWPDSDIPQNIERAKVVVNVAGAATTSLVAALKRWRVARLAVAVAATEAGALALTEAGKVAAVAVTETTALLAGRARARPLKTSRRASDDKRHVRFAAELMEVHMKHDQAQLAISFPDA